MTSPEAVRQFIEEQVARVEPLDSALALAYWNFTTTGKQEYAEELTRLQVALRKIYADRARFERLTSLMDAGPIDDPLLARQAILLHHAFTGNQMDDATIEELTRREVAIESTFNRV